MAHENPVNQLRDYFDNRADHLVFKWDHYFDIYERHFAPVRKRCQQADRKVGLLEIGVFEGGSLQMWNDYFGGCSGVQLFAIDINPRAKQMEKLLPNLTVFIGDQADVTFMRSVRDQLDSVKLDIVVDDGGHTADQQLVTFDVLYPKLEAGGGIYLCEDVHTSYWAEYGGGIRQPGTFVEKMKRHIDDLNAYHSRDANTLSPSEFTRVTYSITFYDSVVLIEKRPKPILRSVMRGSRCLSDKHEAHTDWMTL